MNHLFIGTSGYSYAYWKGKFYPKEVPMTKWLNYYSGQFNAVELNNTFYRFPTVKGLQKAADATPQHFRFAIKAHKIITHTRRMKDVKDKIAEFMAIVHEGIGAKLGCILYQLPPSFSYTEERIKYITDNIEDKQRSVIEFRHSSWFTEDVYSIMRQHKINVCSISFPELPDTNVLTGNIYYKRMHGVPKLFESSYSDKELQHLAGHIIAAPSQYIFFNNTMFEAGYENALHLKKLKSVH